MVSLSKIREALEKVSSISYLLVVILVAMVGLVGCGTVDNQDPYKIDFDKVEDDLKLVDFNGKELDYDLLELRDILAKYTVSLLSVKERDDVGSSANIIKGYSNSTIYNNTLAGMYFTETLGNPSIKYSDYSLDTEDGIPRVLIAVDVYYTSTGATETKYFEYTIENGIVTSISRW